MKEKSQATCFAGGLTGLSRGGEGSVGDACPLCWLAACWKLSIDCQCVGGCANVVMKGDAARLVCAAMEITCAEDAWLKVPRNSQF